MKKEQNTYVMETYKFNIRFNEEDKEKWKLWSIHLAKFDYFAIFPCSLVLIMFAFFYVTNLYEIYMNHPILRMLQFDYIPVGGYLFSADELFWVVGAICCIIIQILKIAARLTMRNPDVVKRIVLNIDKPKELITINIVKDYSKKIIFSTECSFEEFNSYVIGKYTIRLNNEIYKIGYDTKRDMFSDGKSIKKYGVFLTMPKKLPKDYFTLLDISKILEDIKLGNVAERKRLEWEMSHKDVGV